ncbi:phosphoglycerate dehydrogenase [Cyclobacterium marinum]|uniref:D-3-phosphoglycerate dehydrogenase n=1 Tax=Cyclobacterium marinum (strain ATCC 25205 / DSM 745 / LMG 13164 / NCIMB 1802) TaxID=880070 RepID=G0J575_CYCMS|nr:phosphoglycerate dehydrogenase [Cyclobacterium marinum]AEL26759.1 D-isomer specific 2-hydroxyacid dehydrogenase NAD-binding protein [Cyclobacterium marinum DSM 745]MBR9774599.1 phosphoglycerate dehydrogenase [Cytophagales bacterium]|tara:strand:+ start:7912 stop:9804 length:1893 start_codon:yes stop_codon:yes gene_type:complete
MTATKKFIIDFDSTFTKVEALDILGEISLRDDPAKAEKLQSIKDITDQGMEGKLTFRESLVKRVEILNANKDQISELISELKKKVSDSFQRNKEFLLENRADIYIISNGFKDFVSPIVTSYGIKPENVFANEFVYDESGKIIGFNKDNPLSKNNGKPETIKKLNLSGDIYVIGDGYTDYEIKASGVANKFYAFTENIHRPSVSSKADHIAPSLDEILYVNKMNKKFSYPKSRINVLLLENVHPIGVELMKAEGYNVEVISSALSEEELAEKIKKVSVLGIRSKTQVTKKVLENADRLISIGAFCIGTNQIDLETCQEKGIAVFNAPFSNTRSVVELAIAEIIFLMRGMIEKTTKMHEGKWNKSANGSFEIRGKKLGIIGYGNIGSQLSVLAENMGLNVYYYDLVERLALGNATKVDSLDELLETCDVISLHVDGRKENELLLDQEKIAKMKKGAYLINLSRGHVVDVAALRDALNSGHLAGAGIDVFPKEPKNNSEPFESALKGLPNTILTPHIGGSTLEAQQNIARFVPGKIIEYINTGNTYNSVNFPNIQLPFLHDAHRLIHIHHNEPGIMAKINNVLAAFDINIVGQYLKTNEKIGYVITDIDKAYSSKVIDELKAIQGTIRFRVLY